MWGWAGEGVLGPLTLADVLSGFSLGLVEPGALLRDPHGVKISSTAELWV